MKCIVQQDVISNQSNSGLFARLQWFPDAEVGRGWGLGMPSGFDGRLALWNVETFARLCENCVLCLGFPLGAHNWTHRRSQGSLLYLAHTQRRSMCRVFIERNKKALFFQQVNACESVTHTWISGESKRAPVCLEGEGTEGCFPLYSQTLNNILLQDRNCLCADAWLPWKHKQFSW